PPMSPCRTIRNWTGCFWKGASRTIWPWPWGTLEMKCGCYLIFWVFPGSAPTPETAKQSAASKTDMYILCVGQLVADVVVRPVDALPYPGRTDLVKDLQINSGGCAANTAAVLAKLGAEVRLAALIGQDVLGEAALADVKR